MRAPFPHRRDDDSVKVSVVDGNALAGPLFDIFGTDVTALALICRSCGRAGPVAETVVERGAGVLVSRCRGCNCTLMTVFIGADGSAAELRIGELAALRPRHGVRHPE